VTFCQIGTKTKVCLQLRTYRRRRENAFLGSLLSLLSRPLYNEREEGRERSFFLVGSALLRSVAFRAAGRVEVQSSSLEPPPPKPPLPLPLPPPKASLPRVPTELMNANERRRLIGSKRQTTRTTSRPARWAPSLRASVWTVSSKKLMLYMTERGDERETFQSLFSNPSLPCSCEI